MDPLDPWNKLPPIFLPPGCFKWINWMGLRLVKSLSHVWLCDPMNCSLPDSLVHGIFQARVQEWVAISFSRLMITSYFSLRYMEQKLITALPCWLLSNFYLNWMESLTQWTWVWASSRRWWGIGDRVFTVHGVTKSQLSDWTTTMDWLLVSIWNSGKAPAPKVPIFRERVFMNVIKLLR